MKLSDKVIETLAPTSSTHTKLQRKAEASLPSKKVTGLFLVHVRKIYFCVISNVWPAGCCPSVKQCVLLGKNHDGNHVRIFGPNSFLPAMFIGIIDRTCQFTPKSKTCWLHFHALILQLIKMKFNAVS